MIKRLVLSFTLIFTLGLGVWAYKTNYASRSALLRVESINKQIDYETHQIKILNAEWEFLNRPERLRKLVEYYFLELRLNPINPDDFISFSEIYRGQTGEKVPTALADKRLTGTARDE